MNEPPPTVPGEHPMEQPILTVLGQYPLETFFICCAIITFIIQWIALKYVFKINDLVTAGKYPYREYSYRAKDILSYFPDVLLLAASIISLLSCVGIVILRFLVVDIVEVMFSDWEYWLSNGDYRRRFNYLWVYPLLIVLPYLVIFWSGLCIRLSGSSIKGYIWSFFYRRKLKIERSRARARRPSWW
jgi:hypothetical protein